MQGGMLILVSGDSLMVRFSRLTCLLFAWTVLGFAPIRAEIPKSLQKLPVLIEENFKKGAGRWEPTDPAGWKIEAIGDNHVYSQITKRSKYEPPYRSPYNIALLKFVNVGSFVLDAKVKSTIPDYPHRDACLFFNYVDPAQFYYVHLGKKTDDHANQIFIVNKAARLKISTKTTPGTNWDDEWHHVRIARDAKTGLIEIYWDDMKTPIMTATDTNFTTGRVGIGSFDDTTQWDDIVLRGEVIKK
jgi:hypothetical protein